MGILKAFALTLLFHVAHSIPTPHHAHRHVVSTLEELHAPQRDLKGWFGASVAVAGDFALRRAPEVIKLEAHVDSHTNLGACYHNRSILPDAPHSMCKPLYCLWSASANAYIDMWDKPLTKSTRPPADCDKYAAVAHTLCCFDDTSHRLPSSSSQA